MKKLFFVGLWMAILFPLCDCFGKGSHKRVFISDMTCEYLTNPLSVHTSTPRLAWQIVTADSSRRDVEQVAYQIQVASTPEKLLAGKADLWDSGKVKSGQTNQIPYAGNAPAEWGRAWWRVRVWTDLAGASAWSEPAFWGAGVTTWQGSWIGDQPDNALRDYKKYISAHHGQPDFDAHYWANPPCPPSPLLRKTFQVGTEIRRATFYVSALGYYEAWLNGSRIGNQLQAPEWTNYDDYVQYQTYDVTDLLRNGENVLAATLADGWALGRLAGIKWMRNFPHRGFYSTDRRLIAQLVLETTDGNTIVVPTDASWKIQPDGYIRVADNFRGQTIDARRIPLGWNNVGFDDADWANVYVDEQEQRVLLPQQCEPIRIHARVNPVRVWEGRDGASLVNFGQNIAGHIALRVKGNAGDRVIVRHGEWLVDDSTLYTQSLGYALATDTFILSGKEDYFEPTFTYHGFQYAEVSGLNSPLSPDKIQAIAVSSDPPVTGAFECSNPDLNQLYRNIVWTQRNNMFSVLHDNPSRDERTGATGDIQIFAQSAIFNMNMAAFFTKFVRDSKDVAHNGQFFSMIPSLRFEEWGGFLGAPGWTEAAFILPWRLYENYADTAAMRMLYPEMKRHIEATLSENPNLIWTTRHNHNGDWLNANTISNPPDTTYSTTRGGTPDDLFATAFFAYSSRLLERIARVLNQEADAEKYGKLADDIRATFIREYVGADGRVQGDTQGAYSLALAYDLVPAELRTAAFDHLLRCIREYDYRLSTGFITTPMMMQQLVEFGRTDIAYRLLESTRFPSWLYLVKAGATTVWERWDAWIPGRGFQNAGMNSLDHVAFGSVSEWMFRHILGINPNEHQPGYKHFTLTPRPGGSLTWARGHYHSIRGQIASSWRIENGRFTLCVTIPVGTTATVVLPVRQSEEVLSADGCIFRVDDSGAVSATVGSGQYTFVTKYNEKSLPQ